MSVSLARGSPTLRAAALHTRTSRNSSCTLSWRNSRDPAVQDWPWRVNLMPSRTPSAVSSMVSGVAADGHTMVGLLPPSSRAVCPRRRPTAAATPRPISVEPVKETL